MEQFNLGVVDDPRSKSEKKRDWNANEIVSAINVEWKEKKSKDWLSFTERNQYRTSTCCPQSISKLLEVNEAMESDKTVVFSASKAYADRSNSGAGSYLQEMLKFAVDSKYTTEDRIPSQMLNSDAEVEEEAEAWSKVDDRIAKKYGAKAYLLLDKNIDTIAYWLEQGYAVSGLFYFTSKEWSQKYPKILDKNLKRATAMRHAVAIVDYGLIRGVKYLKIEDSAHFGGRSERWVTEEWLTRNFGLGILYDKPNIDDEEVIPNYEFKYNLYYGSRSDEVARLQTRLKKDGFFPEVIPCTGYYGNITRTAVYKYQVAKEVASEWELNWVDGRICGYKTRRALNSGV